MTTKTFTVIFKDNKNRAYQSCKFNVGLNELLLDKLEEALYLAQELVPVDNNWKNILARDSICYFTYHNTEYVKVEYRWSNDNYFFYVTDVAF